MTVQAHPFILGLRYAFHTPAKLYYVLNFCNGGDLYYLLSRCKKFKEQQARAFPANNTLSRALVQEAPRPSPPLRAPLAASAPPPSSSSYLAHCYVLLTSYFLLLTSYYDYGRRASMRAKSS